MTADSKLDRIILLIALTAIALFVPGTPETREASDLVALVEAFKKDPRGPYKRIAWFCPDGTVRGANDPCPEPGGMQHAVPKDVTLQIEQELGIYFGQILAGTPFDIFLDGTNGFSRLKQFQLEKFLRTADDGWIMRRAQHYRGAVQAEDESAWGAEFLAWLLAPDWVLTSQFYLGREISRDIPHREIEGKAPRVRALSKRIADVYPAFMDIRIKIHGRPDAADRQRVAAFIGQHRNKISPDLLEQLQALERDLETMYRSATVSSLERYLGRIPQQSPVARALRAILRADVVGWAQPVTKEPGPAIAPTPAETDTTQAQAGVDTVAAAVPVVRNPTAVKCGAIADLLWTLREYISSPGDGATRLAMMDLSLDLEAILLRTVPEWRPETIGGLVALTAVLAKAAAGCGLVEVWEWGELQPILQVADSTETLAAFSQKVDAARRAVEWGAAMTRASYEPVIALYADFEPLALGFVDDRIRVSILLPLGDAAGRLMREGARLAGVTNRVFDLGGGVQIRGLNPGFAVGELEVIKEITGEVSFSPENIYVLPYSPADLEPVAGIVSVSEGNAVSHVQLLARNLGIPNAAVTQRTFERLLDYAGDRVFYAVSPRGNVVIKSASEMTAEEKDLIGTGGPAGQKIAVPTDKLNIDIARVITLDSLRASDSGRICGPKAANLGQLKLLFPHRVAPGLVIPFGVFRRHMDRPMPGADESYWQFLEETFRRAERHRASTASKDAVARYVLSRLSLLREAIGRMRVLPDGREAFARVFYDVFGDSLGRVPVFIRSDTNMEDLADFTGAGLNLTEANVVAEGNILQAIRDVWASPFSERSYRWRQRYLANPENVFPSILILRSIDVDKSGVMITTGLESANPNDVTVAFNRGAGGAVAGQAAEMYLLREDGADILLAPARAGRYTRLPAAGGTTREYTGFSRPILTAEERAVLRALADEIKQALAGVLGEGFEGPYDVELGFAGGRVWLFQVRPLVENERARLSAYLRAMDTEPRKGVRVSPGDTVHTRNG